MYRRGWTRPWLTKATSPPRVFPTSGFELLSPTKRFEEERLPWYSPKTFYPVRIGQLFQSRYQIIAKLGYGSSSTAWLCRDLSVNKYVAMKVCVSNYFGVQQELEAFKRLSVLGEPSNLLVKCLDKFAINGQEGKTHQCFVLEPLTFSLASIRHLMPDEQWGLEDFRRTTRGILRALKFLHNEAKLVHCDLQQEDFLMRIESDHLFQAFEKRELNTPSPRKIDGDRETYLSIFPIIMPMEFSQPVLCDFGQARPGPGGANELHQGEIQQFPYRSPEILLQISWSYPVDIWNAGVMLWEMFEGKSLFHPYHPKTNQQSDLVHIRDMVALLGPPPPSLLKRTADPKGIWTLFDENGKWRTENIRIPEMSLEAAETRLSNDLEEQSEFIRFIRRFLQWEPEIRATAAQLCEDPWLTRS